ncbi:MAG: lecithin retinol acyltransferase family protein [Corallincola sp.]|nr:lecithin retinol acyltransferase family protein [Corallincola sp.]
MWQRILLSGTGLIAGSLVRSLVSETRAKSRATTRAPAVGAVVYCDLAFGYAEHSGVYVGQGLIAHLNRHGQIELVSPQAFVSGTPAQVIWYSAAGSRSVGCTTAAARARGQVGNRRRYNVIADNCHQFSSGCLTGDFDNSDNFLWQLRNRAEQQLGAERWASWRVA